MRRATPQPWADAIAPPCTMGGSELMCADSDCGHVDAWLPALKRRRTKLIQARDNDTLGKLCVRYGNTSANDLRDLNPGLVADGFGKRADARLRRDTQVCVYCDDDDDE